MSKIPELHQQIIDQAKSPALAKYVWDCGVGPQMGYAFSYIHALAYSFIGFQSAYIATHWNPVYWNAACLVVNSGSLEQEESEIVSIYEKENPDYEYEDLPDRSGKKKKDKGSDYTKVAKAIGSIKERGIEVSLININTSDYGFKPDVEHNRILYGLKALSNINSETIEKIKAGRPYYGIKDFMTRCPLTKTAMLNLIKAGAFDEIETTFKTRQEIMVYYISQVSNQKKRLTLQNFNGLVQHELIPSDFELQIRIFNFTKYLKTYKKVGQYYTFDDECIAFFDRFLSEYSDDLEVINGIVCILQTKWDKIYKHYMSFVRDWIKENQEGLLKQYNLELFKEEWNKYASGNTSHWEMDSVCFYHGQHELANVNFNRYGIENFNNIQSEEIDYYYKRGNNQIPIYKLHRIAGTVLAKNDTRHSITLLTTTGVVTVKFTSEYYAMFKKQISQIQPNGTKKIMEKGWFGRGNMLVITGFRRDDQFVAKTYKNTNGHQLYHIDEIIDDSVKIRNERWSSSDAIEEDEYE